MLERNTIHCGDTFTLLNEVEDASVDLIVCDGPYGVTENSWDKIPSIQEFNLDLIKRFTPKLKDGGALYLFGKPNCCLLYTSPSPRDLSTSRMPSSA